MNAASSVSAISGSADPISSATVVGVNPSGSHSAPPPSIQNPVAVAAVSAAIADTNVSDAVKLTLASEEKPEPAAETKDKKETSTQGLTRDDAEKLANDLEQVLNSPEDTVIRFRVSLENRSSGFRFQVVERETGRVVRQFPPEDILGLKERARAQRSGILVDQSV